MAGCVLRTDIDFFIEAKDKIRMLCTKYSIKPECSKNNHGFLNMTFYFGNEIKKKNKFCDEMQELLAVKFGGIRRRTYGHRIDCPLGVVE